MTLTRASNQVDIPRPGNTHTTTTYTGYFRHYLHDAWAYSGETDASQDQDAPSLLGSFSGSLISPHLCWSLFSPLASQVFRDSVRRVPDAPWVSRWARRRRCVEANGLPSGADGGVCHWTRPGCRGPCTCTGLEVPWLGALASCKSCVCCLLGHSRSMSGNGFKQKV